MYASGTFSTKKSCLLKDEAYCTIRFVSALRTERRLIVYGPPQGVENVLSYVDGKHVRYSPSKVRQSVKTSQSFIREMYSCKL